MPRLVSLVCLAALALSGCSDSDDSPSRAEPSGQPSGSTEVPDAPEIAPEGTELIGLGRVVIAVPQGLVRRVSPCHLERKHLRSRAGCLGLEDGKGPNSEVRLTVSLRPLDQTLQDFWGELQPLSTAFGLEAFVGDPCGRAFCAIPYGKLVTVPDENFMMNVSGPVRDRGRIDAIVRSLTLLPDGYTTVPAIHFQTPNGPAGNILIAAGLQHDLDVDSTMMSGRMSIRGTEPAAGSVVRDGATVTLLLRGGEAGS